MATIDKNFFDDKKIEMQTTTKKVLGWGKKGGRDIKGIMTRVEKENVERWINSISKRGKTEVRGRVFYFSSARAIKLCCSNKNLEYHLLSRAHVLEAS